jgi:hypothetical protein
MGVTVEWVNDERVTMPQHVLLIVHEEVWTWEDMFQAYQDALAMVRAVTDPVHVVIDHSREKDFPTNFATVLPRFAALPIPANVGLIIQVGTRGATKVGAELFSLMYRRLHIVDTLDDAYAMVKVYDARRAQVEKEH